MESSMGKMIFCCISNGNRILYTYNGGDRDLESLAALCLENTPPFHSQYFHTVGNRTFGFLIEDGFTYFAIVDPNSPDRSILQLLQKIRDGFKNNGFQEELITIIKRLISSLESMNQTAENSENSASMDGSISTKAPLLGKSGSGRVDRNKAKDAEDRTAVKIDAPMEMAAAGSTRGRGQQIGMRLWWRHVKIVIAVDVFVCLVLFGIWLAVCRGFQCVS